MRRSLISQAVEEKDEPNITPMLDVVFILLIFFIVTANFIKEPGLEINRPDSETAEVTENAAILIAIGSAGEGILSLSTPARACPKKRSQRRRRGSEQEGKRGGKQDEQRRCGREQQKCGHCFRLQVPRDALHGRQFGG